jgi:hypothetical protein
VIELTDLELNVLEFVHKSFSFDRMATVDGREVAVFHRTETENESAFRPKVIRLELAVPREWIVYDLAADLLVLGQDGRLPGPRSAGTAQEVGAETSEFREQGIAFTRRSAGGRLFYVPTEFLSSWTSPDGLRTLGVEP